jgi:hypothetical protein
MFWSTKKFQIQILYGVGDTKKKLPVREKSTSADLKAGDS